jgi:hypothetical protein
MKTKAGAAIVLGILGIGLLIFSVWTLQLDFGSSCGRGFCDHQFPGTSIPMGVTAELSFVLAAASIVASITIILRQYLASPLSTK